MSKKIVCKPFGIDLGTTFSTIAVGNSKGPVIIKDNMGQIAIPSMVSFLENDECCAGSAAKNHERENANSTVYDAKRMLGHRYNNPRIQYMAESWPFKIVKAPEDEGILIDIPTQNKQYRPYQVSAKLLKFLLETGNKTLPVSKRNNKAVITVPANFTEVQREETLKAAREAGIDVLCLINEPTAAGIACAYINELFEEDEESNVVIYDFGGGTLDVSLLKITQDKSTKKYNFTVRGVDGDNNLGGRDFDEIIYQHVIKELNLDKRNLRLMSATRQAVIDAKILLSLQEKAPVIIDFGDIEYKMNLTRAKFEELTHNLIDRCINPVKHLLNLNNVEPSDINHIILTGGSSHMPFVQRKLREFFGKEPFMGIDPQEAVAKGAAIEAYKRMNGGEEDTENWFEYHEVASRSIGIMVHGCKMFKHIEKNTPLPKSSAIQYNNNENCEGLSFNIFEGESEDIEENDYLGRFEVHGIPLCKQGQAPVEVTITMADNGILEANAILVGSQKGQTIKVLRNIGDYSEQLRKVKDLLIKKDKEASAIEMQNFYQKALETFENSSTFKIFFGQGLLDKIVAECRKGKDDPTSSANSLLKAKRKIIDMIPVNFYNRKEIKELINFK